MSNRALPAFIGAIFLLIATSSNAGPMIERPAAPGLAGNTILIIRHAEKPADKAGGGSGLTPAGEARAKAYAGYFRHFSLDGAPVRLDALVATTNTPNSARPLLTLQPLSRAIGLPIEQPFADAEVDALAGWLAKGPSHRGILIAWRHHEIPSLIADLGADARSLIPEGIWPNETYDWVICLRYDEHGKLQSATRILEPPVNTMMLSD